MHPRSEVPNLRHMNAASLIRTLNLQPHPEGGWYRETWRADTQVDGRATAYVCEGFACQAPVTSAEELRRVLWPVSAGG